MAPGFDPVQHGVWPAEYALCLGRVIEYSAALERVAHGLVGLMTSPHSLGVAQQVYIGMRINTCLRIAQGINGDVSTGVAGHFEEVVSWLKRAQQLTERRDELVHRAPVYTLPMDDDPRLVPAKAAGRRHHETEPLSDLRAFVWELHEHEQRGHPLLWEHTPPAWRGEPDQPER